MAIFKVLLVITIIAGPTSCETSRVFPVASFNTVEECLAAQITNPNKRFKNKQLGECVIKEIDNGEQK